MNSANRTWLNQTLVRASLSEGLDLQEAMPLHDGDELKLGPELTLQFNLPAAARSQPASGASGESSSEAIDEVEKPTRVFGSDFHPSPRAAGPTDTENAKTVVLKK